MATATHHPDIGTYRKIRLKRNTRGYYEIWWTDASGGGYLTRRESAKTQDLAQAQAYLDAFCADAHAQAAIAAAPGKPVTVNDLCQGWLNFVAHNGKDRIGGYVLAAIRRELGHYPAGQLDPVVLQNYAVARRRSNGTIRRELGALRTVLIWAADNRQISRDDVPSFKRILPPHGSPRTRFLDETQEQWFWAEAQKWGMQTKSNYRIWLFVALGLETAARRTAILDLTWDRVDLALGTLDYQVPGKRLTKKRRVRGLPISDRLLPVLKEAWLRAPKDATGHAVGPVVGLRYLDALETFTRAIGVPWVTPHVLRHTWGSIKAMRGVPLYDIAQVMGDTVATIEANYLHLTPDHLRRAVNA